MRNASRLLVLLVCLLVVLPAGAVKIKKTLDRPFNVELYHPRFFSFTADSTEAVITLSRVNGFCPNLVLDAFDSPVSCTDDSDCPSGVCESIRGPAAGPRTCVETCLSDADCTEGICDETGLCSRYVGQQISYVAVIRADEFCEFAACIENAAPDDVFPECTGTTCSSSCDPGICLCSGGQCDETDLDLSAVPANAIALLDDFDDPTLNDWLLSNADIATLPVSRTVMQLGFDPNDTSLPPDDVPEPDAVAFGSLRFTSLMPGEDYFLFLKHTFTPFDPFVRCSPFFNISVDFETVAPFCDAGGAECGNDVVEGNEQCDGTDDAACPGQCGAACECPLLAELSSFTAEVTEEGVLLKWTTVSEIDNAGFHVLRKYGGRGPAAAHQITPGMMPARGGDLFGGAYEYLDRSRIDHRPTLYYLEDVDVFGRTTRHGPIKVIGAAPSTKPRGR